MVRHHCNTIAPMKRSRPPGHKPTTVGETLRQGNVFDKNWQTNNCGCDLQGCPQCDPFFTWEEPHHAPNGNQQGPQLQKLQPERSQDPRQ